MWLVSEVLERSCGGPCRLWEGSHWCSVQQWVCIREKYWRCKNKGAFVCTKLIGLSLGSNITKSARRNPHPMQHVRTEKAQFTFRLTASQKEEAKRVKGQEKKLQERRKVGRNSSSGGSDWQCRQNIHFYLHIQLCWSLYMKLAWGVLKLGEEGKVCCLVKGLYGLKLAGHGWYQEMSWVLVKDLGFTHSAVDHSVFFWNSPDKHTNVWGVIQTCCRRFLWCRLRRAKTLPLYHGLFISHGSQSHFVELIKAACSCAIKHWGRIHCANTCG